MPTLWIPFRTSPCCTPSTDAFDPDWRTAANSPGIDVGTVVIVDPDIPTGSAGDELVLFAIFTVNSTSDLPSITSIQQRDSEANVIGSLTVRAEATQALDAATLVTATGERAPGLDHIAVFLDPMSGPYLFALGNLPACSVTEISVEENYPYVERLSEEISAPGTGIFAGMMVSDTNPGVDVTTTGAGTLDKILVESTSDDYDMVAWSYQTAAEDADFDLTGNWITYAIVLGTAEC